MSSTASHPRISVCIATYRRPQRLAALLGDLAQQTCPPAQVVVVDNDAPGSARAVVDAARATVPFKLVYAVQRQRGIALTRNLSVELADGDWLAFIDDDERAPPDWLQQLMAAAQVSGADGVLAPVIPQVPADAPAWIRRGSFYDFSRMPSGTEVPLNRLRFGNLVLRGSLVRAEPGPFDPAYGLVSGEDADLLLRLIDRGGRMIWCDEAAVTEPIEPSRLRLRWLLQRAFSGGQEYARKRLGGRYGPAGGWPRLQFFMDVSIKFAASCLLCLPSLVAGRHRAAHWLLRAAANLGKLSAFAGMTYVEYAHASASTLPPAGGV